ncbi:MAG TPA: energy-coupling factor transporter transmembrane component T, partial [Halanaerobiales bacterium]|nr:energy-coupling factor transporter transmembrane component T [Halanaerobiales bacterium]
ISIIVSNFFKEDWGFLNRARKFIVLLVGIAFLQSIFSPSGDILISISNFTLLTTGGLVKGLRVILRMLIIIISATIMKGSSPREIIQGLIQWKVHYEISFMVSLAIRFIPILGQEAKDAFTAIQLRGIEIDKLSLTKRFKVYSYMFMPVLSGVIHRARELSTSLEARAFRAYPERTSYIKLELSKNDFLIMSLSIIFTISMLTIYILMG